MRNFIKAVILLTSLLLSTQALSLSCDGITEEFIFSCTDSACIPEFQVSFKKSGGDCQRRPIVLNINEDIGSYLNSEIVKSSIFEDGLYKLVVYFNYWSYQPSEDIKKLKSAILKEVGYQLLDPETGKKPTKLNPGSLLSSNFRGIRFEFIESFDNTTVGKLRSEEKSNQHSALIKYFAYLLVYWGGFLFCFVALVYSANRFNRQLYKASVIDKRSLTIQVLVFVVIVFVVSSVAWSWVGMLLLPVVVFVFLAEIWVIFRKKYE